MSCWETFRRLLDIMLAWDWREGLYIYIHTYLLVRCVEEVVYN